VAALCIVACFTIPTAARDLNPIYINPYGDVVGGEPGEDPHLRLPVIVYPIESFGGECFGEDSRVFSVWDLVFRMLFDVLPR